MPRQFPALRGPLCRPTGFEGKRPQSHSRQLVGHRGRNWLRCRHATSDASSVQARCGAVRMEDVYEVAAPRMLQGRELFLRHGLIPTRRMRRRGGRNNKKQTGGIEEADKKGAKRHEISTPSARDAPAGRPIGRPKGFPPRTSSGNLHVEHTLFSRDHVRYARHR